MGAQVSTRLRGGGASMSPRRPRARYVALKAAHAWAKWAVFDMLTRREVARLDTRAAARSLAKVKNAEDRLKRSLANAVQLEMVDS